MQKLHISLQQEEENRAICTEPVIRTFGISPRPYGASSGETEQEKNRNFCKAHGIRLSGPKLGRPSLARQSAKEKKQEYQDNTDRIEVERSFSLSKRCYGMNCITTKLEETQLTSIALSVFVTNLFRIQRRILCAVLHLFRFWYDRSRCKS